MDQHIKVYHVNLPRLDVQRIKHLLDVYPDAPSYELEDALDQALPGLKRIIVQAQRQAIQD